MSNFSTESEKRHTPGKRRWVLHLHGISWAVLVLMTVGTTLIIVPGIPGSSPLTQFGFPLESEDSHGWPFEYLRTKFADDAIVNLFDEYPIHWTSPSTWRWVDKTSDFKFLQFFADIAIAIVLILAAVSASESWRRRRGRFRFSLLDLAVATGVVCACLGWRQFHLRFRAVERIALESIRSRDGAANQTSTKSDRISARFEYAGPDWIQRLVGNPELLPFCSHVIALDLDARRITSDDLLDIGRFKYIGTVICKDRLSSDLATALESLPNLRRLSDGIGAFSGFSGRYPKPMLDSSNVQSIERLTSLRELTIGNSRLAPADVACLARLSRLESLKLCDRDLLIDDLEPVAALRSLKGLSADITSTQEERSTFEASHPELKVQWKYFTTPVSRSPPSEGSEGWQVMNVLYDRWRHEDGAKEPPFLNQNQVDFSEIRLTSKRVRRIPPTALSNVVEVSLGQVDSVEVALTFLTQCGTLQGFDARRVPLTKEALDRIHFSEQCELYLQQGPISLEEFCEFNRVLKPNVLAIFGSSFSENEAEKIQSASPNTLVEVYSSFVDDENESIYPRYESDANSPFQ